MKKLAAIMLALTVLFTTVPVYAQSGWVQDDKGWRYVDESGNYVVSNWVGIPSGTDADGDGLVDGTQDEVVTNYYYVDANGYMVTGWQTINGSKYYFQENGLMVVGWHHINGNWYYFDEDGKMLTGWVNADDNWYYTDSTGVMLTGWQKIDGQWEYFNTDGIWIDDDSAIQGTIPGIDVSYWQGTIDWDAVKAEGIQFTFIRVGHGERKLDTKFKENISEANRVGIPAGVYFYSTAQTVEQSILDAQFVIDSVQGYTISYPIVIDIEDSSQIGLGKQAITDITKAFCDEIRAAGYTPMVYCNENWYKNYVDFEQLGDVERWIARYAVKGSDSIARDIWQAGSTTRINGINGNADIDFAYTDYSKIITPRTSSDPNYVKSSGYWRQDANGLWFEYFDGTYPSNGWAKIGRHWYLFDVNGYAKTNQWVLSGTDWYYLGADGASAIGWADIKGSTYYFNQDSIMQTGWQLVNGYWYYLGAAGDGSMKTGWQWLGDTWYYMAADGRMLTDVQVINGKTYYFGGANDGAMKTGWQAVNGTWYYFSDVNDGSAKTGWQYINGAWYYMAADGKMLTGWQGINGKTYYLGGANDGSMKSGWQKIDGNWYYFGESEDGSMKTGWQYVDGYWYYMYEDGSMAANTWIGNYYVDGSGAWVE